MYQIDSHYEQPDIEYMVNRARQLCDEGIAIKDVSDLYSQLSANQKAAADNLKNLYGIINPNSSQHILAYFESNMDDNIVQACFRDGKWTTKKEALVELSLKGYQEAIDILTYRKAKKYTETVTSILNWMYNDRRVRPKVSLGKTNRINYSDPALMNIPKPLMWHIIAPRNEGNILISVDIKHQEPWIMINMLNIRILKEILEDNMSGDLYEAVFMKIFDRPCTPIERNELKIAWNAMTYGAGLLGVKALCRHADGEKIYQFFNSIPEFKEYRNKAYSRAKKKIQAVQTYFGTTIYANEYGPKLQRVLMDIPIQGTGADILALLIQHLDAELTNRELEDVLSLYFTRHDELIIEADKGYVEEVGLDRVYEVLSDILEHRVDDWDPFKVKISKIEPEDLFVSGNTYDSDEEE